jgi:hypothetical protein
MKANDLLQENPNLHLTHLEDLALFQGKAGAIRAVAFLRNLANLAKTSSTKKFNVTLKWDGSPAVVCGVDPADGKFFVATKSAFNKDAKLNKSLDDIAVNHPDAGEADKQGLRDKLSKSFTSLQKLGIKNVLQGDLLWTKGDLKSIQYQGEPYVAFKPNTLTYAVPQNMQLAKEIQQANLGIVFHTSYSGKSLDSMTASFDIDLTSLNKTPEVWYDDAYIKDFTGVVNLTQGEFANVSQAINDAEKYINASGNIFEFLEANELGKDFKQNVHANHNNMIRAGAITQDPLAFFYNFAKDYEARVEKAIASLKTGREGPAGQRRLLALEQWRTYYMTNKKNIQNWYSAWLKLTAIKNTLYQKLKNIKQIDAFELQGDEYVVSDQEGFVAVDHVGNAVKIVDRLDFSKKNFAKESLTLVNDLSESRAYRSRQDLGKGSASENGELVYAYCLALIVLTGEYKYQKIARNYIIRSMSYGNYDFFRTNGTDLYLLLHSIVGTGSIVQYDDETSKNYIDRLQRHYSDINQLLKYISNDNFSRKQTSSLLIRLETQLAIKSRDLKKVRRIVSDWDRLKEKEKYNITIDIMHYIRDHSPRSELYGILQNMVKERNLQDRRNIKQKSLPKNVAVGAVKR